MTPVPWEARLSERWPDSRDGVWSEQVSLKFPADLVATVRGECGWTNIEAIDALRDWRDWHPGLAAGPGVANW